MQQFSIKIKSFYREFFSQFLSKGFFLQQYFKKYLKIKRINLSQMNQIWFQSSSLKER